METSLALCVSSSSSSGKICNGFGKIRYGSCANTFEEELRDPLRLNERLMGNIRKRRFECVDDQRRKVKIHHIESGNEGAISDADIDYKSLYEQSETRNILLQLKVNYLTAQVNHVLSLQRKVTENVLELQNSIYDFCEEEDQEQEAYLCSQACTGECECSHDKSPNEDSRECCTDQDCDELSALSGISE